MTAYDELRRTALARNAWDRRRGQRAEVLWRGNYRVVDPAAPQVWQRCYLVDLSESGAAVEIHGEALELGQRVLLRLDPHPTYNESVLQLRADVVNCRGEIDKRVYGLEFAGLVRGQRDHFLHITVTARRNRRHRLRYQPDV